jgi:hypothetical protein
MLFYTTVAVQPCQTCRRESRSDEESVNWGREASRLAMAPTTIVLRRAFHDIRMKKKKAPPDATGEALFV